MTHDLLLEHRRNNMVSGFGRADADSDVTVRVSSPDLTEAWRELLSRLPSDVYAALKEAMRNG